MTGGAALWKGVYYAEQSHRTHQRGDPAELAALIRTVKDPRVHGLVSVTAVDTTPDLRYAKIYVSVLDKSDVKEVVKA